MREIRTSGSMRGGRKRAFVAARLSPTLRSPQLTSSFPFLFSSAPFILSVLSSETCLRLQPLHEPIPRIGCRNH